MSMLATIAQRRPWIMRTPEREGSRNGEIVPCACDLHMWGVLRYEVCVSGSWLRYFSAAMRCHLFCIMAMKAGGRGGWMIVRPYGEYTRK